MMHLLVPVFVSKYLPTQQYKLHTLKRIFLYFVLLVRPLQCLKYLGMQRTFLVQIFNLQNSELTIAAAK